MIQLPPAVEEPLEAPELPAVPPAAFAELFVTGEPDDDAEPEVKVPFYKRDLSFKRKPGEKKPRKKKPSEKKNRDKKPRNKKPSQKKPRAAKKERLDDDAKVPFYKRGVTLRRPKAKHTEQPEQIEQTEQLAPSRRSRACPRSRG